MTRFLTWIALKALILLPSVSLANVIGSDTQNFVPIASGLDFVSVHSSETLKRGYFNLGLFGNTAYNTLPRKDNSGYINDRITAVDFSAGFGLARNLDVGVGMPYVAHQRVEGNVARAQFGDGGFTEVRASVKYRFLGNNSGGMAAVFSYNHNLMHNNPYIGIGGGDTYNFEFVADTTIERVAMGVNLGYRLRNPGKPISDFEELSIYPQDDQYIFSGAMSYYLRSIDTKFILEAFASTPAKEDAKASNRELTTAEALFGVKYDVSDALSLHAGVGSELYHGTSSAEFRFYGGINWSEGPKKVKISKKPKKKKSKPKKKKKAKKKKKFKPQRFEEPTEEDAILIAREPDLGGDEVIVLRDINFLFDSDHDALSGAKNILRDFADHLRSVGYRKVVIEGHTDSIGSDAYNDKLSLNRAKTIFKYLASRESIPEAKMRVEGYGERYPIAANSNQQGRQANRRVVFRIYYSGKTSR